MLFHKVMKKNHGKKKTKKKTFFFFFFFHNFRTNFASTVHETRPDMKQDELDV